MLPVTVITAGCLFAKVEVSPAGSWPACTHLRPLALPRCSATHVQIGYVAQDDTLLPTLTVEECIRYSAILRLHGCSTEELQAAVEAVMAELGLAGVARSRVGGRSGIRGISGGERRRWGRAGGCQLGRVGLGLCE